MAKAAKKHDREIIKDQSPSPEKSVVSYKGFDKNLQCRGFQFEIGKTYTTTEKIEVCSSGFHACADPLDVWSYYPPIADDGSLNRYAVVTQCGEMSNHDDDSKVASASITINLELSLPDFIRRAVDYLIATATNASSGDNATNASSGDNGRNSAIGKNSVIMSAGIGTENSGVNGTWIGAAEYDETGKCVGIVVGRVGQDGLKENTPYVARGGKFVEAD